MEKCGQFWPSYWPNFGPILAFFREIVLPIVNDLISRNIFYAKWSHIFRRSKFKANLEFIYQISVKSTYLYTQLHFHEILTNSEFSKLCFYSVHSVCRKTKTSVSIKKNFVKSVYYETL